MEHASSRVLVIDDDASMRFTLEAVLGDAGLQVESSADGASALQAFEARGADAVLTDLAMSEMDGLQVLERLRAQDPGVPVLMLTAHGSERIAVASDQLTGLRSQRARLSTLCPREHMVVT